LSIYPAILMVMVILTEGIFRILQMNSAHNVEQTVKQISTMMDR